jgi:hypothetical protein
MKINFSADNLKAYEVGYDKGYVDALGKMKIEINDLCRKYNTNTVDKDEFIQIINEYAESIY